MATDLENFVGQINLKFQLTATTDKVLGIPTDALNYQDIHNIAFGTGDDQSDQMYYENNTYTETDMTYDLQGGLVNNFGQTINFATIKGVVIKNNSTMNNLEIGPGITWPALLWFNSDTSYEIIPPGGISVHIAPNDGWDIIDETSDEIYVSAQTAFSGLDPTEAADFDIIIWGTSL